MAPEKMAFFVDASWVVMKRLMLGRSFGMLSLIAIAVIMDAVEVAE